MQEYVRKLKALADETRLRIFHVLLAAEEPLCVCEIVDALDIPSYAVSRHMKELRNAGFVTESRDGKFVMYALADNTDDFFYAVTSVVRAIPDTQLQQDIINLHKRLALRENGKCIIGAQR